jgi:hypothetical protein
MRKICRKYEDNVKYAEHMRKICEILDITENMRNMCGKYTENLKYAENMQKI